MSKKHFNFKSSIRDWYIRAFPSDELGYRINPLATFAGAVKCMADGGDIYKYLGVGDSLVRENVFSKIAAITGVDYDAVYGLWLHHDEDECSRLVFLGDHPDCAVDRDWREQFDEVVSPSEQVRYDEKTLNTSEIIDTLRRFESPSYIVRGPIEDIESLPVGYYWCPDALDPDPSYNGYLLNVFAGFDGRGLPGKFFELFGGVTLNDVPSFGFDDGWDGSCLNRLDWFEDAAGMDADGLSAGLVANDAESIKALIGNCPAWIECFPSYSEKAAKGVDDAVQAVKAYRLEGKRVHREVIPGYLYETAKAAAAKTAGGADGGTGPHI